MAKLNAEIPANPALAWFNLGQLQSWISRFPFPQAVRKTAAGIGTTAPSGP
jgi:hypothetical protein